MVEVPPAGSAPEPVVVEPTPSVGEITSASGWATFHGDLARTGTTGATPIATPRIAWKQKLGIFSWLNAPLAIAKSVVIAPSSGTAHNKPDPADGVYALDMASGKRLWHAHFDQDANGVAATRDRVFATSDDGNVYALELRSGKVAWKQAGSGKMYTYPLLVGDRVIVGDAGGYVHAYAIADGKELWKVQLTGAIRGGASADEQNIYVTSQGGEVAAISPNGKLLWHQIVMRPAWNGQGKDQPIEAYAPVVVGKDALYLTFSRDTYYKDQPALYALDKKSGSVKWRAKGPGDWGNVRTTPALVAGTLVWGEPYSGDVVGFNAGSGRMAYRKKIGPCFFPQWSSPATAGDLVYLPRFDGSVYAVRATSGKVEWQMYLGDSQQAGGARPPMPASQYGCDWDVPVGSPIYAPAAVAEDGRLLVGTGEGVLYMIEN